MVNIYKLAERAINNKFYYHKKKKEYHLYKTY